MVEFDCVTDVDQHVHGSHVTLQSILDHEAKHEFGQVSEISPGATRRQNVLPQYPT